jgi:hypothetical protein
LSDIAKANSAAWNSIYSVNMEYMTETTIVENGIKKTTKEPIAHWIKQGNKERLKEIVNSGKINTREDYYLDGSTTHILRVPDIKNADPITCCDQKGVEGKLSPQVPLALIQKSPQLLNYIYFIGDPNAKRLSEIISQWNVTLKEEPLIVDGNTLWCIHAVYVPVNATDVRNGNYMDIYVNQNKGFLTQKISYYEGVRELNQR